MKIGQRKIGRGQPVFVVAELSCSHGGDLDAAMALIEAAAAAGADAVKFQLWLDPAEMASEQATAEGGPWDGENLRELYAEAQTPLEWFPAMIGHAGDLGLEWFCTPFSFNAVNALEAFGCPAYKIASFELPWHDLITRAAGTGKPVILSTGMATLAEISNAVRYAPTAALLHCVSSYPAPLESMNLGRIARLASTFPNVVGLSSHATIEGGASPSAEVMAVALGAMIIEKHIGLEDVETPDSGFALPPAEFGFVTDKIREAEEMLRDNGNQQRAEWSMSHLRRRKIGDQWLRG